MKLQVLEEDRFFLEHANLRSKDTGQPFDVWLDELGCDRNVKHNEPRFKFTANNIQLDVILHNNGELEIVNNPREVRKFKHSKKVIDFIKKFEEPLRKQWNHELTTYETMHLIRTVYKTDMDVLDALSKIASGEL